MKKLLASAAIAAATIASTPATAQALPAGVIAVVDLDRVTSDCNACKTATAALRTQAQNYQARQKALVTPLQTEQKSIQAAIDALQGKDPDAALQNRIRAFQTKQQQAEQDLATQGEQIKRNQLYIQKQIADKLNPIYSQVMQRRGANVLIDVGQTLASAASIDISNDVLAALNSALTTISTTAPAQAAPQGR